MEVQHALQQVSLRASAKPLSEVLAYSNPDVVDRIAREHEMSTVEAEAVFQDTIRFLYLAGATDANHLAPTKNIDKGWHEFLMFTRDYAEFCDVHFGRFIHHEPRRQNTPRSEVNQLEMTYGVAQQVFGPVLSRNWAWGTQASDCAGNACNSSCSPTTGGGGNDCSPTPACESK